jgi:DtxR family Mn-dependent transcriptional regulator
MQTRAVEDYLKTIYGLQAEQGQVATTILAERLGVAPASATNMVKKLAEMQLVTYQPYYGLTLTDSGQKMALKILRCHRLVELYLAKMLGLSWDEVHAEAEKWEHVLSEEMEERLDAALGRPTADPHGAPIPGRDGTMAQPAVMRLTDLKPGQATLVAKVGDHNSELLRYLGSLGLYPGVRVDVVAITPRDGLVIIRVDGNEYRLGYEAARHIFVTEHS